MKNKKILGAILGLASIGLGVYWYDWKLSLIIFLALFGNNLERSGRNEK